MGSLIRATCPDCGLDQGLPLGGGFSDHRESARVPAGCDECHRLVLVNARQAQPWSCPSDACRGVPALIGELTAERMSGEAVVFDWGLSRATRYVLRSGLHPCPVCGGERLTFAMAGHWD